MSEGGTIALGRSTASLARHAPRQIWPCGIFAWGTSCSIIFLERRNGSYGKGAAVTARTTVAILGGNSVAGRALEALLQGVGYDTRLIEDPPESEPEELLDGVKLLLLAPTLSAESREILLADMRSVLDASDMPVLTLSTTLKEALVDQPLFIPWPCRLEDLTRKIEAALLRVPEVGMA